MVSAGSGTIASPRRFVSGMPGHIQTAPQRATSEGGRSGGRAKSLRIKMICMKISVDFETKKTARGFSHRAVFRGGRKLA